jgi:hypothetical protein
MEEFVKKQRDQTQASFVHYTSAEAALRITREKTRLDAERDMHG